MTYNLTYEQAMDIATEGQGTMLCLATELLSDQQTPITVVKTLKAHSKHCFLLESVDDRQRWGRYSFLGFDPKLELACDNHVITLTDRDGNVETSAEHPNKVIRKVLAEHISIPLPNLPPLTGGLVGYFGYDYIKYQEPSLDLNHEDPDAFKDIDLMLFDQVICFDNFRQKIILLANFSVQDGQSGYEHAQTQLQRMHQLISSTPSANQDGGRLLENLKPRFSKEEYCAMVDKAKHYIYEGDIFQVVLSNRWEAAFEGSLLDTYRILRTTNPSPYMFYFSGSDIELSGASPETLVNLQDKVLHTFPLAGTRPRGKTEEEDIANERSLLSDEKELAEHNMLVDLGRNDLGKISKFSSVVVEEYLTIQRYSHVMHIGSTVKGTIADGYDALDAIAAVLPAGTLSGAPKIRACEIIEELEHTKRGIYGGAVGYLGFNGNMDTCIAIRLAYRKGGKVYIRSGAGIVADSVSVNEWQECANKAKAVEQALALSSGGLI